MKRFLFMPQNIYGLIKRTNAYVAYNLQNITPFPIIIIYFSSDNWTILLHNLG